jgi:DNA-binding NtrC family response regulator
MTRNKTVLIVDDEYGARESLKIILDSDYNIITAASYDEALPLFGKQDIDLVLLDICMPGKSGLDLLETLRQQGHQHRVIMVTAMQTLKTAVRAMKQGALDYITKPYDIEEIRAIVAENIQKKSPFQNNSKGKTEAFKAEHIIGYNTTLQPIFNLIHRLARTHSTVLITGESGTGKELIARAIHEASVKQDGPFIAVHLGDSISSS